MLPVPNLGEVITELQDPNYYQLHAGVFLFCFFW